MITLKFYNQQSAHRIARQRIQGWVARALPLIQQAPGPQPSTLTEGMTVDITFVNDAQITQIHADFLADPTPTDVITFPYGEILISTETAARQAAEHRQPLAHELALYAIHGLLHLHGHEDHTAHGAATMQHLQNHILRHALAQARLASQ